MSKQVNIKKEKEIEIEYGVKSIREISYSIVDSVAFSEKDLQLSVSTNVEFLVKTNEINITPLIIYSIAKSKKEILKIEVLNVFGVKNMKKFEKKNSTNKSFYDFPEDFIDSLVGVSISHSRAFLAKNTSGTKLEKFILPLLRSSDLKTPKND